MIVHLRRLLQLGMDVVYSVFLLEMTAIQSKHIGMFVCGAPAVKLPNLRRQQREAITLLAKRVGSIGSLKHVSSVSVLVRMERKLNACKPEKTMQCRMDVKSGRFMEQEKRRRFSSVCDGLIDCFLVLRRVYPSCYRQNEQEMGFGSSSLQRHVRKVSCHPIRIPV